MLCRLDRVITNSEEGHPRSRTLAAFGSGMRDQIPSAALVGNRCQRARIQPSFATLRTGLGQVRDWVGLIGEEPLQDLEAALPHMGSRENRNVRNRPGTVMSKTGYALTDARRPASWRHAGTST
jgi:hypothetical protein